MSKNNVIQFPLDRIKRPVDIDVDERLLHELTVHEECIDLGLSLIHI